MTDAFDYIVVGAGSAGAVIATRLSEDASVRVLLLEAGGSDHRWDWRIHMPAALAYPMNGTRYNWDYHSEPEREIGGRRIHHPRGKVLGGSSSINGMAYVRGNALDYDGWADITGFRDWRYAGVLPYFRRAETYDGGTDAWRGGEGPLHVSGGKGWSPLYQAFRDAGVAAGYGATADMNGYRQEGFGRMDMTVHKGRRWSTAVAYLRPARGRANLTVQTGAMVTRVLTRKGRATGVTVNGRDVLAEREVILCGGAVNSPQLLMLSGIGPADHLRGHGIDLVHDLPGVGQNLQDHLELYIQHLCTKPVTLYPSLKPWNKALIGMQWLTTQTGLGATNHFEAGAFIRSGTGVPWADIQYHFLPMAVRYDGKAAAQSDGFQAHVGPMRSKSRGELTLVSADPAAKPRLAFNYMSEPDDWTEMRAAVRLTREIFAQKPFDPFRGAELAPGAAINNDADLDAFIRERVESAYHPCGTCAMGSDAMAVVDGDLRLHGIEGLRVADASIMPRITTGNLNAPTIMIGEKAADLIRGASAPPPSNAPVWIAPDRDTTQRERDARVPETA